MARFRLYDPVPQWRDALGDLPVGGKLTFYDTGTTTPRVVYSADTGGVSLGNQLTIDEDGRLSEDFWLEGSYRVVLTDSSDQTVWQRDEVRDVASGGLTIPDASDGTDGQVLSTDGTPGGFVWVDLPAIPSQTGNAGEYLTTDGEAMSWAAIPTYSATSLPGGVLQGSTSFQIGKLLIQTGTGTIPTAAGNAATVAVTFGTAYATLLGVSLNVTTNSGSTSQGCTPVLSYSGSTTGFTARGYAGDEHEAAPNWHMTSTTPFFWVAFGLVA